MLIKVHLGHRLYLTLRLLLYFSHKNFISYFPIIIANFITIFVIIILYLTFFAILISYLNGQMNYLNILD